MGYGSGPKEHESYEGKGEVSESSSMGNGGITEAREIPEDYDDCGKNEVNEAAEPIDKASEPAPEIPEFYEDCRKNKVSETPKTVKKATEISKEDPEAPEAYDNCRTAEAPEKLKEADIIALDSRKETEETPEETSENIEDKKLSEGKNEISEDDDKENKDEAGEKGIGNKAETGENDLEGEDETDKDDLKGKDESREDNLEAEDEDETTEDNIEGGDKAAEDNIEGGDKAADDDLEDEKASEPEENIEKVPESDRLRAERENNARELQEAKAQYDTLGQDAKNKFELVMQQKPGTEEYRRSLQDFNDAQNQREDLKAKITELETRQTELDREYDSLRLSQAEKDSPIEKIKEPVEERNDSVEALNDTPREDITSAFEFAENNYEKDTPQWQEAANRQLESLKQESGELQAEIPAAKAENDAALQELSTYIGENGLTENTARFDRHYLDLNEKYMQSSSKYQDLVQKQRDCSTRINEIEPNIDQKMKTSFKGRNGSAFEDSYNGIITSPQGKTVPNFGGTCGINETCSIVNQQTGSSLDEANGIKEYTSKGLCEVGGSYGENGGTSPNDRSKFLADHGLSFESVKGAKDTGIDIDLDSVAQRFNNGESAGIMLKAEDLSQPGLSSRKYDFSKSFKDNQCRYESNHATTIAGFSYDDSGKATGVWINDTGEWTGKNNNRVFIDKDKFNQMQKNTKGFAVEFSKKR